MMLVSIYKQFKYILLLLLFLETNIGNAQVWSLKQCLDSAKIHNRTLKVVENSMLSTQQKHKEAIGGALPKITLLADYKYYTDLPYQLIPMTMFGGPEGQFKENQFGVPHNINANIQFSMPIYNPILIGGIATSRIASELSELQYRKSNEQLVYEVTNTYYSAQILQKQIFFIDSNIVNTTLLLKNIQLMKTHMLAKSTDVSKVQLQLEQLKTQKEMVESKNIQLLNSLKFLIGIPVDSTITIDNNIIYNEFANLDTNEITDVSIANAQSKLIKSELQTLKNSRLPSLSLYGTYGKTGYGYTDEPEQFLDFYPLGFVGVQLSIPLFNGTVTQRKINQKKIEYQSSILQKEIVSEQNKLLYANALNQKEIALKSIVNMQLQVSLATDVYNQTILQQHEGTANLTDVILADNALRESQQALLSSMIEYLKADLDLRKLSGNLSY